ncbi:glycosyltransferase family protein [Roseibium sediminis]|uniref:glycosyltransferase family protein n=1 Tax=Roseibium sediminis TaxID=1775174 RepID=UPI00123D766B|nr:glycosyltransferase [Roseibium sediminis]
MSFNVFIHVQHLLGTGHAVRAASIGKALMERGARVTLATGNMLPPTLDTGDLKIVQLPAVRSPDAVFNRLVTLDNEDIDDAWKKSRLESTLEAYQAEPFDLLLTETYPFGRRQFEFELSELLKLAKARSQPPLIATSIRDILVRKQELWKEEWMADQALTHYDRVLVHSDPDFVQLGDSFPFADRVEHLVRYTGYVGGGERPEPPEGVGEDEVIISCGGGAVAENLLSAALEARPLSRRADDVTWRILVGHDVSEQAFQILRKSATEGLIVERARKDFPGLLKRARLSVSQAGYNTVLDILIASVPAVFVPFAQVKETEQAQRADALAAHGRAVVTPEKDLTPERLAAAIDDALALPRSGHKVMLGGAEKSADILMNDLKERAA